MADMLTGLANRLPGTIIRLKEICAANEYRRKRRYRVYNGIPVNGDNQYGLALIFSQALESEFELVTLIQGDVDLVL